MGFLKDQMSKSIEAFEKVYPGQTLIMGAFMTGYDQGGEYQTATVATKVRRGDAALASFSWASEMEDWFNDADW